MTQRTPSPLMLGKGWFPDEPGGLNRYYRGLFQTLTDLGAAPSGVVAGPAHEAPSRVTIAGPAGASVPRRLRRFLAAARDGSRGADLVDAHFALYSFLPVVLGAFRGKPLVVHFHGPWAAESAVQGERRRSRIALRRAMERAVYRRAAQVVALSASMKRTIVEEYGVSPWRVQVVPPGVDLDRFCPGDQDAARDLLGLPRDAWIAFTVRRLVPRMGLFVLLDAWSRLPRAENAFLVVAGEGPQRAALAERARQLGVESSVRFLGRVPDELLPACYRAADVCVIPSVALEGFGLVAAESLACGTPAIVTDVGGLPEALAGLDRTLVVPAADPAPLAQRLSEAMEGTVPLPSRRRCRSYALRYSWAAAAARHAEIYRQLVERDAARRRVRVVYLSHCSLPSGGELALLRLLPALRDVEAHVILAEDGPLVGKLLEQGASVEVLPLGRRARSVRRGEVGSALLRGRAAVETAVYVARLARRLRRLRPDIVHTNSLKAAIYGGLAGRVARVPVVWHVRDRIAADYLSPRTAYLVRAAGRRLPSAVVANSRATAETLGRDDVHVVPSPTPPRPSRRRRNGGPLRVGIVGRLAPWKGQDLALAAFARAFPDGPERMAIVGAALFGPEEERYADGLRKLSIDLGLRGRVDFRGFRDDVAAELDELDVLVHSSVLPEPFGQVVVEGMAAGLAVVAPAEGGPAEIISDGVTGLLYQPGDVSALAAALGRLAEDAPLRRQLGAEARAQARDYSPAAIAERMNRVYEQVLARR